MKRNTKKISVAIAAVIVLGISLISGCSKEEGSTEERSTQFVKLHGNSQATKIPFIITGMDINVVVEVVIGDYSESILPEFGPDKDVHWEEIGDTIRVYFHPKKAYKSDQGDYFDDTYWSYVGISAPSWLYGGSGGYLDPVSIKGKQVNFKGEFRFIDGGYWERRSIAVGAAYAYYEPGMSNEKVVAFNNAGWADIPFSEAYFSSNDDDWWHNLYYGTWWNDSLGTEVSDWVLFDLDVTAASQMAIEKHGNLGQDDIKLWGFYLGPELKINNWVIFEIRNLEAAIQ